MRGNLGHVDAFTAELLGCARIGLRVVNSLTVARTKASHTAVDG